MNDNNDDKKAKSVTKCLVCDGQNNLLEDSEILGVAHLVPTPRDVHVESLSGRLSDLTLVPRYAARIENAVFKAVQRDEQNSMIN